MLAAVEQAAGRMLANLLHRPCARRRLPIGSSDPSISRWGDMAFPETFVITFERVQMLGRVIIAVERADRTPCSPLLEKVRYAGRCALIAQTAEPVKKD
jgi:hypothetical protein